MKVKRSREDRLWPSLLLGMVILWTMLWFVHALGYWEDDAWIHLEFARSLAEGRGWQFNGRLVYGDTSPLWVWLLEGFRFVLRNWMVAGKALTLAGAAFALSGVYRLGLRLSASLPESESRFFAATGLLLTVTNCYFGYWAFSGMEALTAAGVACWALVAAITRPMTPRIFLAGALLAGLAPLLRPEMGFLSFFVGVLLLHGWVLMESISGKQRLLLFAAGLVLLAGPTLAWGAYAFHTFGAVLPNTNAAKRASPSDSILARLLEVYGLGFPLVLLAGACLLAQWGSELPGRFREGFGRSRQPLLDMTAGALSLWSAASWIFYITNHTFVQTRYVFVSAPLLTLGLLAAVARRWPRLAWRGMAFGIVAGVLVSLATTWPLIGNKVRIDRDYARLAAFLHTLPADEPVAHYSIGEAAFLSRHPLVDLGGITRPGVIPFLWDATDDRRIWWAHHEGARYMVLDHSPEPGATRLWETDVPATGWYLDPRRYRAFDRLEVWKLPKAPTLAPPQDMPDQP